MEWIMWWTGSNKMTSICCTICEEAQSSVYCTLWQYVRRKVHNMRGANFIHMLKIYCFARKNECTGALLAMHANNWLRGGIFHNSRIFLQNISIGDRIHFKTAQYCWFVSKFWTGMPVHWDAEQALVSYPFPPALPVVCVVSAVCCPSISVSVFRTTNCTVSLAAEC